MRRLILAGLLVVLPACSGVPIPDSDGDGIPDLIDPCPQNPDPACVPDAPPVEAYDCDNPPALTGLVKVKQAIPDIYIVVQKPGARAVKARGLAADVLSLDIINAFVGKLDAKALSEVLADPAVAYVQQNGVKSIPPVFAPTSGHPPTFRRDASNGPAPLPVVLPASLDVSLPLHSPSRPVTDTAEPFPGRSPLIGQFMPVSAMGHRGSVMSDMATVGHGREVGGVDASSGVARVMESDIPVKRSNGSSVGVAMRDPQTPSFRESTIPVTIAASNPNPAAVFGDSVRAVEVHTASIPWNLDRVDQRDLPLDKKFQPNGTGAGVHVYINDTGVSDHRDFGSRLSPDCYSTIVFRGCQDGHGHGTHVAGTTAGTEYGVAKQAIIHSVRFLDDKGSGTDADAIRTLEWIAAHDPGGPGVVNASWGGSPAPAVDAAVCKVIQSGKVFVAAAGNESADSKTSTPARIKQVLTVGATEDNDTLAYFSNFGPDVDILAPGVNITSAAPNNGSATMSGTSMAAPHVTGGAALYRGLHPSASPAEVATGLTGAGTPGKIGDLPSGTPNLLLFVGGAAAPPDGSVPPKGQPVSADRLLRPNGTRLKTNAGQPWDAFQAIPCCMTFQPSGTYENTRWPLASEAWMDYTSASLANSYHFRMGPWFADEETEVEWQDIGGPYQTPGGTWNPAFWEKVRALTWHAHQLGAWVEVVPIDSWGCKYSQAGNRYVAWPADAIEACGRTWHPEHERYARKVVEELGCFGNVFWALDNEFEGITRRDPNWIRKLRDAIRDEEGKSGCGFTHLTGTSEPSVRPEVDYSITHQRAPVHVIDGRWTLNNERNPNFTPAEEQANFAAARKEGLGYALWRSGMDDAEFVDTLARFKAVVEGYTPPPPVDECTLGTPTAREALAQGKKPTLVVQRTVAGSQRQARGMELREPKGKWISATPYACFGRAYYCSIGWAEACAEGKNCGPVAPEGNPQRLACEQRFLEAPCPTFTMDHCTGTGDQCPITWDPYIVIGGVNQFHPENVRAGCRESKIVRDPAGNLILGEWWKATAHGKGFLKACNGDRSVCGISTFEINQ